MLPSNQVGHIVKPRALPVHKAGGVHSPGGKQFLGLGGVGQRDDLMLPGEDHLVLPHNGAAPHRMQADLVLLPLV